MLKTLKRYQIIYGITIVTLTLSIIALFAIITQFHFDHKKFEQKNKNSSTYSQMKTKQEKLVLNPDMKKWLENKQNTNKKYYKIIIKGFGSNGQIKNGFGIISSSLRIYYVQADEFVVEGAILKHRDMLFCGSWQILPVTPQDYICNVINNKY